MPRIPRYTPAMLDDLLDTERAELHARIANGRRIQQLGRGGLNSPDGSLRGPFNAMVHAPSVGRPLDQMGVAIRFDTSLSDPIREAAILQVAARHRSTFEWRSHAPIARSVGVPDDVIAAILAGTVPAGDDDLATSMRVVASLLERRELDEDTYTAAAAVLGTEAIVELTALVGHYELLQLLLAVFHDPDADLDWAAETTQAPADHATRPPGSR